MYDDCTQRRTQEHCGDRFNPSRQSRIVAFRERRVCPDARDGECQDRCRQIRDSKLPDSGIPCAHRKRRQAYQSERLKGMFQQIASVSDAAKRRSKQKGLFALIRRPHSMRERVPPVMR